MAQVIECLYNKSKSQNQQPVSKTKRYNINHVLSRQWENIEWLLFWNLILKKVAGHQIFVPKSKFNAVEFNMVEFMEYYVTEAITW